MLRYIWLIGLVVTLFAGPVQAIGRAKRPFIVYSPPRSGTHMHAKALEMLVGAPAIMKLGGFGPGVKDAIFQIRTAHAGGSFIVTHNLTPVLIAVLQKLGYKIIFPQRDLRDQLVSLAHFIQTGLPTWPAWPRLSSLEEQIEELITGATTGFQCVERCFLEYEAIALTTAPNNLYISRFEKLVGPRGGGSADEQLQALFDIAAFLEFDPPLTIEEAQQISENLFGGTAYFRKGQIGEWRTTFTDHHKELFDALYSPLMDRLNY